MNWRERAKALFFVEKKTIVQISEETGVSIRSISKYLNLQPDYKTERENRKIENQRKNKEDKKQWSKINYRNNLVVNNETLKREHNLATYILSKEKY